MIFFYILDFFHIYLEIHRQNCQDTQLPIVRRSLPLLIKAVSFTHLSFLVILIKFYFNYLILKIKWYKNILIYTLQ
jgi:hypothetical protein